MSTFRSRTRRLSALVAVLLAPPLLAVTLPSAPATAGAPYVATVAASATSVTYGTKVTLRGKVSPAADGQRVVVQRSIEGGTWTTIARPRLNSSSRYGIAVTPAKGRTAFRVVKARSNGHAADKSPAVTVKAWRWRSLVGVVPVSSNDLKTGTFMQHGYTHGKGVSLGDNGFAEWRVRSWRCVRVRATIGVADSSPSGATFNAAVSWSEDAGDDLSDAEFTLREYESPRLFQMVNRYETITADDTVSLAAYRSDGGPADSTARLVFAAPAVYCNS